jgi:hypothetical protein
MEPWLIGAVVGGLGAGLVLLAGFAMPRRKCPDCGQLLPHSRKASDGRKALWGGATCPKCDWVDRRGRKILIHW